MTAKSQVRGVKGGALGGVDFSWWEVAVGKRVKNWGPSQEGAGYSILPCLGYWCFCTLGKGPTQLREYHPEAPSQPQTSGEHVEVWVAACLCWFWIFLV